MAVDIALSSPVGYAGGEEQTSGPLVGFNNGKRNVLRYSFKTPADRLITSLTFWTVFNYIACGHSSNTYNVRFKVTDDPDSYVNAGAGYNYDGSVSFSGTYTVERTCTINGLMLIPNKTYYLFLFPGEDLYSVRFCYDENGDVSELTAETSPAGLAYINNGTEFEPYQVYIYNGSDWEMYFPYIYNGATWDLYT